jgi:hypothetical protein
VTKEREVGYMQFLHIAVFFFAERSRHGYHTERVKEGVKHLVFNIMYVEVSYKIYSLKF